MTNNQSNISSKIQRLCDWVKNFDLLNHMKHDNKLRQQEPESHSDHKLKIQRILFLSIGQQPSWVDANPLSLKVT